MTKKGVVWTLLVFGFGVLLIVTIVANWAAYTPPVSSPRASTTLTTSQVTGPGRPVHDDLVLAYFTSTIRANGKRCWRISSATLWALSKDKAFVQVLCDSTGPTTGFWYGVTTDWPPSGVSPVESLRGPRL
jgi:hypothetical protein